MGLDASVSEFWAFAMSDLRMNNVRGYLAEWLVAKAVGATTPRVEWDAYDVLSPDDIRIEVKASAYVQAWNQTAPSSISFTGLYTKTWTPETGYSETAGYNADVYVFCVQTAKSTDEYDALDVGQWEFYVAPAIQLVELGQKSMGLRTVQRIGTGPLAFLELDGAIREAAKRDATATARAYFMTHASDGIRPSIVRTDGATYERWHHETRQWHRDDRLSSEVRLSDDWYPSSYAEIQDLVARR